MVLQEAKERVAPAGWAPETVRRSPARRRKAARISPERAWTLVHDAGRLGLRALFQQARLSQDLYLPLRIAVDVYHEMVRSEEVLDREHFRRQIIERILTQPDGLKNDDLDFLLYQIARQEQIIAQREGEAADAVRAASA